MEISVTIEKKCYFVTVIVVVVFKRLSCCFVELQIPQIEQLSHLLAFECITTILETIYFKVLQQVLTKLTSV